MIRCRWSNHETGLHLSKKGRLTPAYTPLLSSQDLKTVYCLYIYYFHLADCTWRRADAWSEGDNSRSGSDIHCSLRKVQRHVKSAICCMSYLVQFCSCVFSVLLALRLPRLGKRELILVLFVRLIVVLVWICRFPLPLDVWEGLRFVIVALPGLFSYLFCILLLRLLTAVSIIQTVVVTARENIQCKMVTISIR